MGNRDRRRSWNPFGGLEHPVEVWAWGMYDLANQSFTLLINTLMFAVFFQQVVVGPDGAGNSLWGAVVAASLLIVVVISPIAGAIGDQLAIKKPMLIGTGVMCVAFTCALALLPVDHPGELIWLAALLYIPANVAFALGENFLASFLPEVARRDELARVSAIGWTMGYAGALALLGLSALLMWSLSWDEPRSWRPLFVVAGLWFLVMASPTAVLLNERARREPADGSVVAASFGRIAQTARQATSYAQLLRFLAVFFVYAMGVQAMIFFAGIVANGFGYSDVRLSVFLLPVTVFAGVGAVAAGWSQKRFGYRRGVHAMLVLWLITAASLAALHLYQGGDTDRGKWALWVVGGVMGFALGGIGTASRAMVGALTPAHKTAEFFGLWGLSYKLAGVVGVLTFGIVRDASVLGAYGALAVIFALGFVGLFLVREDQGVARARAMEASHLEEITARDRAAETGRISAGTADGATLDP